jgi:hypothetical protein
MGLKGVRSEDMNGANPNLDMEEGRKCQARILSQFLPEKNG